MVDRATFVLNNNQSPYTSLSSYNTIGNRNKAFPSVAFASTSVNPIIRESGIYEMMANSGSGSRHFNFNLNCYEIRTDDSLRSGVSNSSDNEKTTATNILNRAWPLTSTGTTHAEVFGTGGSGGQTVAKNLGTTNSFSIRCDNLKNDGVNVDGDGVGSSLTNKLTLDLEDEDYFVVINPNFVSTTLTKAATNNDLILHLDDVSKFPSAGSIFIGSEEMAYEIKDTDIGRKTITVTRARNSTSAAAHIKGKILHLVSKPPASHIAKITKAIKYDTYGDGFQFEPAMPNEILIDTEFEIYKGPAVTDTGIVAVAYGLRGYSRSATFNTTATAGTLGFGDERYDRFVTTNRPVFYFYNDRLDENNRLDYGTKYRLVTSTWWQPFTDTTRGTTGSAVASSGNLLGLSSSHASTSLVVIDGDVTGSAVLGQSIFALQTDNTYTLVGLVSSSNTVDLLQNNSAASKDIFVGPSHGYAVFMTEPEFGDAVKDYGKFSYSGLLVDNLRTKDGRDITTLDGGINNSVDTFSLNNAELLSPVGILYIGTEQILYTALSGNTVSGCKRGYNSTSAASHSDGDTVISIQREDAHIDSDDEVYTFNSRHWGVAFRNYKRSSTNLNSYGLGVAGGIDGAGGTGTLTGPQRYIYYKDSPKECNKLTAIEDYELFDSITENSPYLETKIFDIGRTLHTKINELDNLKLRDTLYLKSSKFEKLVGKATVQVSTSHGVTQVVFKELEAHEDLLPLIDDDVILIGDYYYYITSTVGGTGVLTIGTGGYYQQDFVVSMYRKKTDATWSAGGVLTGDVLQTDKTAYRRFYSPQRDNIILKENIDTNVVHSGNAFQNLEKNGTVIDKDQSMMQKLDFIPTLAEYRGVRLQVDYGDNNLKYVSVLNNSQLYQPSDHNTYTVKYLDYFNGDYVFDKESFTGFIEEIETTQEHGILKHTVKGRDIRHKLLSKTINRDYTYSNEYVYSTRNPIESFSSSPFNISASSGSTTITSSVTFSGGGTYLNIGDAIWVDANGSGKLVFLGFVYLGVTSGTTFYIDTPVQFALSTKQAYVVTPTDTNYFMAGKSISADVSQDIFPTTLRGSADKGVVFRDGNEITISNGTEGSTLVGTSTTGSLDEDSTVGYHINNPLGLSKDSPFYFQIGNEKPISITSNTKHTISSMTEYAIVDIDTKQDAGGIISIAPICPVILARVHNNTSDTRLNSTANRQHGLYFLNTQGLPQGGIVHLLKDKMEGYLNQQHTTRPATLLSDGVTYGQSIYRYSGLQKGDKGSINYTRLQPNSDTTYNAQYSTKLGAVTGYAIAHRVQANEGTSANSYALDFNSGSLGSQGLLPITGSNYLDVTTPAVTGLTAPISSNETALYGYVKTAKTGWEIVDPKSSEYFLFSLGDVAPDSMLRKNHIGYRGADRKFTDYGLVLKGTGTTKNSDVVHIQDSDGDAGYVGSLSEIVRNDDSFEILSIDSASIEPKEMRRFGVMRLIEATFDWHFNPIDPEHVLTYKEMPLIDTNWDYTVALKNGVSASTNFATSYAFTTLGRHKSTYFMHHRTGSAPRDVPYNVTVHGDSLPMGLNMLNGFLWGESIHIKDRDREKTENADGWLYRGRQYNSTSGQWLDGSDLSATIDKGLSLPVSFFMRSAFDDAASATKYTLGPLHDIMRFGSSASNTTTLSAGTYYHPSKLISSMVTYTASSTNPYKTTNNGCIYENCTFVFLDSFDPEKRTAKRQAASQNVAELIGSVLLGTSASTEQYTNWATLDTGSTIQSATRLTAPIEHSGVAANSRLTLSANSQVDGALAYASRVRPMDFPESGVATNIGWGRYSGRASGSDGSDAGDATDANNTNTFQGAFVVTGDRPFEEISIGTAQGGGQAYTCQLFTDSDYDEINQYDGDLNPHITNAYKGSQFVIKPFFDMYNSGSQDAEQVTADSTTQFTFTTSHDDSVHNWLNYVPNLTGYYMVSKNQGRNAFDNASALHGQRTSPYIDFNQADRYFMPTTIAKIISHTVTEDSSNSVHVIIVDKPIVNSSKNDYALMKPAETCFYKWHKDIHLYDLSHRYTKHPNKDEGYGDIVPTDRWFDRGKEERLRTNEGIMSMFVAVDSDTAGDYVVNRNGLGFLSEQLSGTVSTSGSSTTVTGSASIFKQEISVGDNVIITEGGDGDFTTTGGDGTHKVSVSNIVSNTSITVGTAKNVGSASKIYRLKYCKGYKGESLPVYMTDGTTNLTTTCTLEPYVTNPNLIKLAFENDIPNRMNGIVSFGEIFTVTTPTSPKLKNAVTASIGTTFDIVPDAENLIETLVTENDIDYLDESSRFIRTTVIFSSAKSAGTSASTNFPITENDDASAIIGVGDLLYNSDYEFIGKVASVSSTNITFSEASESDVTAFSEVILYNKLPYFVGPNFQGVDIYSALNYIASLKDMRVNTYDNKVRVRPDNRLIDNYSVTLSETDNNLFIESVKVKKGMFNEYNQVIVYGDGIRAESNDYGAQKDKKNKKNIITLEEYKPEIKTLSEAKRRANKLLDLHSKDNKKITIRMYKKGVEYLKSGDIVNLDFKEYYIDAGQYLVLEIRYLSASLLEIDLGAYSKGLTERLSEILSVQKTQQSKLRGQKFNNTDTSNEFFENVTLKELKLSMVHKTGISHMGLGVLMGYDSLLEFQGDITTTTTMEVDLI